MTTKTQQSILDLRAILARHRRKMALTWTLLAGIDIVVTLLTPSVYRSEGRLFVRLGRENVTLDPTATIGQGPISAVPQQREGEINSVVEILKGRPLIEQLVDSLTPEVILADH